MQAFHFATVSCDSVSPALRIIIPDIELAVSTLSIVIPTEVEGLTFLYTEKLSEQVKSSTAIHHPGLRSEFWGARSCDEASFIIFVWNH